MSIEQTQWYSHKTGNLCRGCQLCVKGKKLVLFITGNCAQKCFYCPISEHKYGNDAVYANEWKISDTKNPTELIEEAKLTGAEGAGITGGDPLTNVERCIEYITLLKKEFGQRFHIHLYTPLKLVTKENLEKLHLAGLDEIRFHPDLDDDKLWPKLELAKQFKWTMGVEIPVVPGYGDKIKKLIDYIKDKVEFINLNELEVSDTEIEHYKLTGKYKPKDEFSYGAEGSEELALELLSYINTKRLDGHYCTAKLKDAVQVKKRMEARAERIKLPWEKITKDATLIRGCAYLPELSPGVHYHETLKGADKKPILEKLNQLRSKLIDKGIKDSQLVIDGNKLRILLPFAVAQSKCALIKKIGLLPARVEEYPTADALEMDVEFL